MMRQSIGALIFLIATTTSWAKVSTLAPMKMRIEGHDLINIKGYRGSVEYKAVQGIADLTIEVREFRDDRFLYSDEWQFGLRREGQAIMVNVEGPSAKQAWRELVFNGRSPQFELKIVGPSLPMNINWNEGKITVTDVASDIQIACVDCETVVRDGVGTARIFNQSGHIQVSNHRGSLNVDTYSARMELAKIDGEITLRNFAGESSIASLSGNLNIDSYSSPTKVNDVKGKFNFTNGISPLHISKFEGELRGLSAQGPVFVDIRGEADVRMESGEGNVSLNVPASGAWVNLGTNEGSFLVPNFLKMSRHSNRQVRTGRLRSGSTGGNIFVRTSKGNIKVR